MIRTVNGRFIGKTRKRRMKRDSVSLGVVFLDELSTKVERVASSPPEKQNDFAARFPANVSTFPFTRISAESKFIRIALATIACLMPAILIGFTAYLYSNNANKLKLRK